MDCGRVFFLLLLKSECCKVTLNDRCRKSIEKVPFIPFIFISTQSVRKVLLRTHDSESGKPYSVCGLFMVYDWMNEWMITNANFIMFQSLCSIWIWPTIPFLLMHLSVSMLSHLFPHFKTENGNKNITSHYRLHNAFWGENIYIFLTCPRYLQPAPTPINCDKLYKEDYVLSPTNVCCSHEDVFFFNT